MGGKDTSLFDEQTHCCTAAMAWSAIIFKLRVAAINMALEVGWRERSLSTRAGRRSMGTTKDRCGECAACKRKQSCERAERRTEVPHSQKARGLVS